MALHCFKRFNGFLLSLPLISALSAPALATDCSAWPQFSASERELAPLSLGLDEMQNKINAGSSAEGMIFEFTKKGSEVWMDVTYVPDNATVLAGMRSAWQAFRLLSDDFDSFVFADNGVGLYKLSEPVAREIGCQFIWGREGGQNPIHLMRVFYQNLANYADGMPAVTGFNGSLLGDTNRAITFNNEVFVQKWLISAVQ
jgi:hypothetical protein